MRDILIIGIIFFFAFRALRQPWIGVLLWAFASLLNPHRFTYGFAYNFPVAAVAAAVVGLGLFTTTERDTPFKAAPATILGLFMLWVTISWLLGLDPGGDYEQWTKVMKILVMVLVGIAMLRSKEQIVAYTWVCAGSLALLGIKGGLFTLTSGGGDRVYGPPGSFIAENNSLALALVTTIPLLRFLQTQLTRRWAVLGMTGVMLLVAASALGSHSRGALLAISAMGFMMWLRGRNKLMSGVVMLTVGVALVAFMPDNWTSRMATLNDEQQDDSVMGRYSAWWVAWGIAKHYPFGVGFEASRPELFALYSPYPQFGTPAAHSIYFQVLGHHGFVGLALYLAMWFATWRAAASVRKQAQRDPRIAWAGDLAAMCQVALVGFWVGGTFLSLAYFDLPYNIMAIVVLLKAWVIGNRWEKDVPCAHDWRAIVGWRRKPPTSPTPKR